jgi:hypothetical protein
MKALLVDIDPLMQVVTGLVVLATGKRYGDPEQPPLSFIP